MQTYTVSISVEVSFQMEVVAINDKRAKDKAEKEALNLVDIEFKEECLFPETYLVAISAEAIDKNED